MPPLRGAGSRFQLMFERADLLQADDVRARRVEEVVKTLAYASAQSR